jgi:hypothetical protein
MRILSELPNGDARWPKTFLCFAIFIVLVLFLLFSGLITGCAFESPSQAAARMTASPGQDAFAQRIAALKGKGAQ